MDSLVQQIRYAFRSIRRTPLLSLIVVATLSISIALVTTFYSFVNSAFYHPLPYQDVDRFVLLSGRFQGIKPEAIRDLRQSTRAFDRIGAYSENWGASFSGPVSAFASRITKVDTGVFDVLGVRPILGSLPTAQEIGANAAIVLINARMWRRHFDARPDVVGLTVRVDGRPRRIIGVMPDWFTFPTYANAWIPLTPEDVREAGYEQAVGRLRPGATFEDAKRDVNLVGARWKQIDSTKYKNAEYLGFDLLPGIVDRGTGRSQTTMLVLLVLGSAICVVLVACSNIASLMLARGARRRGEMLVRTSLGASRWQLVSQQVVESLVLAIAGCACGILLSVWGIRLVIGLLPAARVEAFPGWLYLGVDWRVLGFATALSLFTVLLFGVWPATVATRVNLSGALRSAADQGITGRDPTRRLHLPVVLELTLSLVLFVTTAMMFRTFKILTSDARGYAIHGLLQARIAADPLRDTLHHDYTRSLIATGAEIARRLPQSQVVTSARFVAFTDSISNANTEIKIPTRVPFDNVFLYPNGITLISDNYFRVLGIPLIAGRAFTGADSIGNPIVAIVSRRFAMDVWGEPNVLGKYFTIGHRGRTATVVGIAENVKTYTYQSGVGLVDGRDVYLSIRQGLSCCGGATYLVRPASPTAPSTIAKTVTSVVQATGNDLPVTVERVEDALMVRAALQRILSTVLSAFATIGLALALMGIYGVVAFNVEQRAREVGVRIALGATGGHIIRTLMIDGAKLVGIATIIGLAGAAAAAKIMSSMIVGSTANHAALAVATAAVFGAAGLFACYAPARRSAKMDATILLRQQ